MKNLVVLRLHNEVEAQVLTSILDQDHIPYVVRSFHDSAFDGLFQNQLGWGQIEAEYEYGSRINSLVTDMDEEF
jgi:hypothetical protein